MNQIGKQFVLSCTFPLLFQIDRDGSLLRRGARVVLLGAAADAPLRPRARHLLLRGGRRPDDVTRVGDVIGLLPAGGVQVAASRGRHGPVRVRRGRASRSLVSALPRRRSVVSSLFV